MDYGKQTQLMAGGGFQLRGGSTYKQDYRMVFNNASGNLTSRQDYLRSKTESFTYDTGFDRLLTVTGPQNLTMNYAANGNFSQKSDVGSVYTYGTTGKPYQLTGIETSTGLVSDVEQTVVYTSFEQPSSITESPYQALFTYNADGERAKMEVKQSGATIKTRWYAGSRYLKETAGGVTKEFTWIGGDAYSAPCLAVTQSGTTTYYYLLRDHLGTITHVTDASGNVVNEYNFDAWGRRRNFTDWSYTVAAQTDILPDRGFTGHEYLPWFKLYNMNGRLYDPIVGRFLEPDPVVQDASSTQNLNRYSYCLNNPLKYTDPSGYRKRRLEPGPGEERWISEDAARIMGGFGLPGGYAQYRNNLSNYSYNLFNNYQAGQANSITDVTYPFYNVNRNYRSIYGDGGVRIPIYKHTAAYVEMDGIYYFKGYGYTFAGYQVNNGQRGNGYAEALYIANTINSLYEENATLNLKALTREAQELKNVRRKVPSHINKAMDANKFTKVITKSVGKKLYGIGLVFSAVDMYEDPSASNIAWNVADGIVGWAAFVPGLQIPALIYFTGRISYDIYDAYDEP